MADHDDPLEPLATAVADGAPIDWDAATRRSSAPDPTLEQLRALAAFRRARTTATTKTFEPDRITTWVLEAVLVIGVLKISLSFAGTPVAPLSVGVASTPLAHILYLFLFSGAGLILLYGGRADPRARALGCCYVMIATSATHRPIEALVAAFAPSWSGVAAPLVHATATEAFEPVFFLVFAARFPTVQQVTRAHQVTMAMLRVALIVACAMVVLNVLIVVPGVPLSVSAFAMQFDHSHTTYFWQVVLIFWVAALLLILWRSRAAPPLERRRAHLLVGGVAVGLAPILFFSLLIGPLSPIRPHLTARDLRMIGSFFVYPFLFSIPITTAYAVLVERVLDVRMLVGQALQYALARSVVLVTSVAPLTAFIILARAHRDDTIAEITQYTTGRSLLLLASAGILGLLGRQHLLVLVDRFFLRERHDARSVLAGFGAEARTALGVRDVATTVREHLSRAFHPDDSAVLVRSRDGRALVAVAGRAPSLVIDSGLATILGAGTTPVVLGREDGDPLLALVSPAERAWLSDTGFTVLVPLPASDGELLGALAMCDRRGGIPFSDEDLLLVAALASAAAATLEHRRLRETGSPPLPDEAPAAECPACGLVHAGDATVCPCGSALVGARVPLLLAGKFRAERRLGAGAMGVVYAAIDTALARPVAIKALPRLTTNQAARLRTEARAMARVSHPNVAMIYALETWRDTPLLIVERLDGGTLAQRLRRGPVAPAVAVPMGVILAGAVAHMHKAGLLHGDIKPSNVGFTTDGVPKLIDFGLARLQVGDADDGCTPPEGTGGTPLYLPPEVLAGAPADETTDVWSLNLVIYQTVAGTHPFHRDTKEQTVIAIRRGNVPDARSVQRGVPPALAEYLGRALARDRSRRPATARAVQEELSRILVQERLMGDD